MRFVCIPFCILFYVAFMFFHIILPMMNRPGALQCPNSSLNAISLRQYCIEMVGVSRPDLPFEANLFQSCNPVMREIHSFLDFCVLFSCTLCTMLCSCMVQYHFRNDGLIGYFRGALQLQYSSNPFESKKFIAPIIKMSDLSS